MDYKGVLIFDLRMLIESSLVWIKTNRVNSFFGSDRHSEVQLPMLSLSCNTVERDVCLFVQLR